MGEEKKNHRRDTKCVYVSNLKNYERSKLPFKYSDEGRRRKGGRKKGGKEGRQALLALFSTGTPKI